VRDDVFNAQEEIDLIYSDIFGKDESKQAVIQPDLPSGATARLSDELVLQHVRGGERGLDYGLLLLGCISEYANDHSAADLALCNRLAYFCSGDAERVDRLFRNTGLMRPKWDERHASDGRTYGEITIAKAISGLKSCYGQTPATTDAGAAKPEPDGGEKPQTPEPVSLSYDISGYQIKLVARDSRQTYTKNTITWDVTISRDDPVSMTISTAGQSIRNAARDLANMAGYVQPTPSARSVRTDIEIALRKIMYADQVHRIHRHLTELKRNAPHEGGETMQQILIRLAPKAYRLAFRNDDGSLFSELYGRDISRQEFYQSMTEELATACKGAVDYPNNQHQIGTCVAVS